MTLWESSMPSALDRYGESPQPCGLSHYQILCLSSVQVAIARLHSLYYRIQSDKGPLEYVFDLLLLFLWRP